MIVTSIQWIGWTKPAAGPETQVPPVAQTAPTTPSLDPGQVQQMTQNLATLRQTVEQLAGGQDQMARERHFPPPSTRRLCRCFGTCKIKITRSAAKLLSRDKARRIAANLAKLPELLRH